MTAKVVPAVLALNKVKDAQFVRPGPDLRLRNLFICPRAGPGTSPRRSCTHSGKAQLPGELTWGKVLAFLRRYTLLLGESGWFGAGANREKGLCCRKALLLPLRAEGLRWGKVRAAQALLIWGHAPSPPAV